MDPTVLRDHLNQLHAELGEVHRVDPAATPSLAALMQDLRRLMDVPPAGSVDAPAAEAGTAPAMPDEPLPERLEKIAVQFEIDHPTLAESSRRLVDLLGKIGV